MRKAMETKTRKFISGVKTNFTKTMIIENKIK